LCIHDVPVASQTVLPWCIQGVSRVCPVCIQAAPSSFVRLRCTQILPNVYPMCIQGVSSVSPGTLHGVAARSCCVTIQLAPNVRRIDDVCAHVVSDDVALMCPGCIQGVSIVYPVRANVAKRANCASYVYPGCIHGVSAVYPAYVWRHGRFLRDVSTVYPVCIQCVFSVCPGRAQALRASMLYPWCIQDVSVLYPWLLVHSWCIQCVSMLHSWCIQAFSYPAL
jgi:hypothetical protein